MPESDDNEVLDEFKRLGTKASYHYADDSTHEWDLADEAKTSALALFDAYPELEARFRSIARDFLWSLTISRPRS